LFRTQFIIRLLCHSVKKRVYCQDVTGSRKITEQKQVLDLGKHIVVDPKVCHGKPTYRGTRIMVWQVLEALGDGESVDDLVRAWGGRIGRDAVLESIRLAESNLLNDDGNLRHSDVGALAA
jgi:uncharacterized protein (DUF433 family)